MVVSSNFKFLDAYDDRLARLGALAERYFFDDAPSALIKLRQLGEFLAKEVAARHGLLPASSASFDDVLRTLKVRSVLPREIADLFFHLKRVGNAAVHENIGTRAGALSTLKIARAVAIWFHQSYGGSSQFKPGPFVPPAAPIDVTADLKVELEELRKQVKTSTDNEAKALLAYQEAEAARLKATTEAEAQQKDREFWEAYAAETEAGLRKTEATLKEVQAKAEVAPPAQLDFWMRPPPVS
jgi:type I restriction enzyme R subunit